MSDIEKWEWKKTLVPKIIKGIEEWETSDKEASLIARHEEIYKAFGIEKPTPGMPLEKGNKLQLEYMMAVEQLKEFMLREHKVLLVAQRGVGLKYVPIEKQINYSLNEFDEEVCKSINKVEKRVNNCKIEGSEKHDALAKIGAFKRVRIVGGSTMQLET